MFSFNIKTDRVISNIKTDLHNEFKLIRDNEMVDLNSKISISEIPIDMIKDIFCSSLCERLVIIEFVKEYLLKTQNINEGTIEEITYLREMNYNENQFARSRNINENIEIFIKHINDLDNEFILKFISLVQMYSKVTTKVKLETSEFQNLLELIENKEVDQFLIFYRQSIFANDSKMDKYFFASAYEHHIYSLTQFFEEKKHEKN
jgi:hypothetical protein